MHTLRQQRDGTGLVGRLRQVLTHAGTAVGVSTGLFATNAEDLPGLYLQVAPDGAILRLSKALAEALGTADPVKLRGCPIATYLPAAAPGTPLYGRILDQDEIRDVPVRLRNPLNGTHFPALLSARADAEDRATRGAWMGCFTLPTTQYPGFSLPPGVDRELWDGIRIDLLSQLVVQLLQTPPEAGSEVPESVRSLVRMCLLVLPRFEAILALDAPFVAQSFDARASIAELCRATGRLIDSAGISLIFDSDPAASLVVTSDENRLRACLNLLLGAVSTTENPAEIVVRLAESDSRSLNVEIVAWRAAGRPAPDTAPGSELELARALAATSDGTVSVHPLPPDCVSYRLRVGLAAKSETDAAIEAGSGTADGIEQGLKGLHVLFLGFGPGQQTVFATWIARQSAEFLHAASPADAQSACGGLRPDVAVLDLSMGQALPDFLRNVPVLGLGNSIALRPECFRAVIEKPVFEEDLIDALSALLSRGGSAKRGAREAGASSAARILAVDDNPVNQRIILKMLVRLGYEVDLASNGLEALIALRKSPYDVVLMDWEMPVMDGLEATATIRGLPSPLSRIPVIALTAHAMQGDREVCLRGGMDEYLTKPLNIARLKQAVDRWLPRSPRRLVREESTSRDCPPGPQS